MKNKKKTISVVIMVLGIVLFIIGIVYRIPYTYINDATRYVGGDAYNYIIEASIKGGKISGATVAKAVYISIGTLLFSFGLFVNLVSSVLENKNEIEHSDTKEEKAVEPIAETQQNPIIESSET